MAARLRQARQLRGLSQREVGVRMGLDKETASARISRYESESMAISLESLFELALGEHNEAQQVRLAEVLEKLSELPPKKRNVLIEQLSHLTKE